MSLHYGWTLSLRFRRDVPEAFLEDLRFAFGIGPGFAPDNDGSELPGGLNATNLPGSWRFPR